MSKKIAETPSSYAIDCGRLMKEGVWTEALMADLEDFFAANLKVNGKRSNFKNVINVETNGARLVLSLLQKGTPLSKKYIKYLVKKFLHKQDMRDMFRAISTDRQTYALVPLPSIEEGMAESE